MSPRREVSYGYVILVMIHLTTASKTLTFLDKWNTMNQLRVSRSGLQEVFYNCFSGGKVVSSESFRD